MPVAVHLEDAEWQMVMAMMALAPWRDANPLLMKIGQQLQAQQQAQQQSAVIKQTNSIHKTDGKEIRHE